MDKILRRTKVTVILMGVAMLVLGIAFFVNPTSATLVVTLMLGWTLVIVGGVTLGNAFYHRLVVLSQLDLFIGALELVLGICILASPGFFVTYLFLLLGIIVLVSGINDITDAMAAKSMGLDSWKMSLGFGILTLLLGVLVIMAPFTMAEAVMMVAGIALVLDGVTEIVAGVKMPSKTE